MAKDHTLTIITLPGLEVELISNPKDNEGQLKVVILASNIMEWTVVCD